MKIEVDLQLPKTYGEIVSKYLNVLEEGKEYDVFTIDDDLNIIKCRGIIENNGSYNYHNNYDDSENELFIIKNGKPKFSAEKRWFTLNRKEVEEIQQENIHRWESVIEKEIERLKNL